MTAGAATAATFIVKLILNPRARGRKNKMTESTLNDEKKRKRFPTYHGADLSKAYSHAQEQFSAVSAVPNAFISQTSVPIEEALPIVVVPTKPAKRAKFQSPRRNNNINNTNAKKKKRLTTAVVVRSKPKEAKPPLSLSASPPPLQAAAPPSLPPLFEPVSFLVQNVRASKILQ